MTYYLIRRAVADDLDAVLALRREAEKWLAANDINQWTPDYADYANEVLADWVGSGNAWVVVDGGQVVGTVSVMARPDLDFWGWMKRRDRFDALYLGKMIVKVSHRHRGIGDAIMNWASLRASAARVHSVRIDVRRDNARLQQYYLDRGFTHRVTWHEPKRRTESGWLAQRPAGSLTSTEAELVEVADSDGPAPAGCLGPAVKAG